MNQKSDNQSNGSWLKLIMDVGRTFGVPTVLLLLISYWLLWQITPPIMSMFVEFFTSTMKTQAVIVQTQSEIADTQRKIVVLVEKTAINADEIISIEKSTQDFMKNVEDTHNQQMDKLNDIIQKSYPNMKIPDSSRIIHKTPVQLVNQNNLPKEDSLKPIAEKINGVISINEKPVLTNTFIKPLSKKRN